MPLYKKIILQLPYYLTPLLLLGSILGLLSTTHPTPAYILIFSIITFLAIIALTEHTSKYTIILLLFLTSATLTPAYLNLRSPKETYYNPKTNSVIINPKLTLISDPIKTTTSTQCVAKDTHNRKFLLKIKKEKTPLRYADTIKITGKFLDIKGPTNPGEQDYRKKLIQQNISGVINVVTLEKTGHEWENPFKSLAFFLRHKIHTLIRKTLPEPHATLYISLIFGDSGLILPEEIQESFKKIGLTHLLVVSGAQVALLSGIFLSFITPLSLSNTKKFFILTVANLIFLVLTGGEASILRAVIMNEIALLLLFTKHKTHIIQTLSLTALIMLVINPHTLWDIGAHLSFLATASLIFLAPALEKKMPKPLAICLSPFLVTTPYIWIVFKTLTPISLLSNLLIMTWAEWIVILGFFSTLIGLVFFPLAYIINQCSYALLIALTFCVATLEKIPHGTFVLKTPQPFSFTDNKLKVTYLDVGQGDSILIETPQKKTILIDTGPVQFDKHTHQETYNTGKRIIYPVLTHKGIRSIDLMIITHRHLDHMGGTPYLLSHLKVKTVIGYVETKNYAYLNAPSHLYTEPNLALTVLYPFPNHKKNENENNNSIVTKLTYKNTSFLFTGDLETEGEEALTHAYKSQLRANVLKLGHHGSKTSSTPHLMAYVHPQIAIVSAGKNNRYRHPAPSLMYRLQKSGIRTFRTDQDGAIEIVSDGNKLFYSDKRAM